MKTELKKYIKELENDILDYTKKANQSSDNKDLVTAQFYYGEITAANKVICRLNNILKEGD